MKVSGKHKAYWAAMLIHQFENRAPDLNCSTGPKLVKRVLLLREMDCTQPMRKAVAAEGYHLPAREFCHGWKAVVVEWCLAGADKYHDPKAIAEEWCRYPAFVEKLSHDLKTLAVERYRVVVNKLSETVAVQLCCMLGEECCHYSKTVAVDVRRLAVQELLQDLKAVARVLFHVAIEESLHNAENVAVECCHVDKTKRSCHATKALDVLRFHAVVEEFCHDLAVGRATPIHQLHHCSQMTQKSPRSIPHPALKLPYPA